MDYRERNIYNKLNPYLFLKDEDWIHLDLSKKEIPVIYYTFYFPTNEWKSITIFSTVENFENYLKISESSEDTLQEFLSSCVRTERLRMTKSRMESEDGRPPMIISEDGGIRINPYYLQGKL